MTRGWFLLSSVVCLSLGIADVSALNLYYLPQMWTASASDTTHITRAEPALQRSSDDTDEQDMGNKHSVEALPDRALPQSPEPTVEHEQAQLLLSSGTKAIVIHFDSGRAAISTADRQRLQRLAQELHQQGANIVVEGHTDTQGDKDVNQRLSQLRAQVVANFLKRRGFSQQRIRIVGYGESMPLPAGDNGHDSAQNRRVEIKSTSLFR